MKLRHSLSIFGLVAMLGLGVGVGLASGQKPVAKAEASTSETIIYIDARTTHWFTSWGANYSNLGVKMWTPDVWLWNTESTMGTLVKDGVTYLYFNRTDYMSKTGGLIYAYNDQDAQNRSSNFTFSEASEGQNLLTLTGGSNSVGPTLTWGTLDVGSTYTVTRHGICDGDKENSWVIGSDSIEAGDTYAIPARHNVNNYHFGGWFTDDDCTEAYVAGAVNANLNLYAKYTSFSQDSYIYFVTDSTSNMVHTWGGDEEYATRDVSVAAVALGEVHGVLQFRGSAHYIYKIAISSESDDTKIKFHYNNYESEGDEQTLEANSAYYWTNPAGYDKAKGFEAIEFLLEAERIRNLVSTESGAPANYSICGISKDDAEDLCELYNGLSEAARGYVDASTTYTYNPDVKLDIDPEHQKQVSYYAIMEELAAKAGVSLVGHVSRYVPTSVSGESSNNTIIIVIAASSIAVLALIGGYFYLRKRKEDR